MHRSEENQSALQHLGESFELAEEVFAKLERFVCQLYGKASRDVNDLRYKLFCTKGFESQQLPPTRDGLPKHICRANYQAAIWKRSLESHHEIPSPAENGWKIVNEQLKIDWNDLPSALDALLELLSCSCNKECANNRCSCFNIGLPCTDVCNCTDVCENKQDLTMEEVIQRTKKINCTEYLRHIKVPIANTLVTGRHTFLLYMR